MKTYNHFLENIQDWCVSRQLWWRHQIPAWFCPDGHITVTRTAPGACATCKDVELVQDEDVLDTWFSSGLWPFSTMGWPGDVDPALKEFYPGSVLVTAFDIIFFWVARMMMQGIHFMGEVPFKDVYIHALVRDEKGQKMSKSKGNVIDPLELVDEFGADALRMTLSAMAAQGRDIKLSNAARFANMNECRLDQKFDPLKAKHTLNRWIISEVARTAKEVSDGIT